MKLKMIELMTFRLNWFAIVAVLSIVAHPATAAPAGAEVSAKSLVPPALVALRQDGSPTGSSNARFDFGTVSLLDDSIANKDAQDEMAFKPVVQGIKHVFTFRNTSSGSVKIDRAESDCGCINAYVWGKNEFKFFPYVVPPKALVKFIVGVEQDAIAPGKISATVNLVGQATNSPIATLTMSGMLTSGITFSGSSIDFGDVFPGQSSERTFSINVDNRIKYRIPPGEKVVVTSSNPHISIKGVSVFPKDSPLQVKEDAFFIPKPKVLHLGRPVKPGKTAINFVARYDGNMPNGPIGGRVTVGIPDFPMLMIFDKTVMRFSGRIKGQMAPFPLTTFFFDPLAKGASSTKSTDIFLAPNVNESDVRVSVTGEGFSATLTPLTDTERDAYAVTAPVEPAGRQAEKDASTADALPARTSPTVLRNLGIDPLFRPALRLSVVFTAGVKVGSHDGTVKVLRASGSEYLSIKAIASVK